MKSMKEYQDVLIILEEVSKSESKANKLIKISVKTEDDILKGYLNKVIIAYKNDFKPGGWHRAIKSETLPNNHREFVEYLKPRKKDLKDYIENILSQRKPQWQILAERAGWKEVIIDE